MAAGLAMAAVLTGCGADAQELAKAREAGAAQASAAAASQAAASKQAELEAKVKELEEQASATSAPAPATTAAPTTAPARQQPEPAAPPGTSCGNNLSVNSATTCQFAQRVYSDWLSAGGGSASFYSYSPVTQTSYWMSCTQGVTTVCRGGINNNAVVYIR